MYHHHIHLHRSQLSVSTHMVIDLPLQHRMGRCARGSWRLEVEAMSTRLTLPFVLTTMHRMSQLKVKYLEKLLTKYKTVQSFNYLLVCWVNRDVSYVSASGSVVATAGYSSNNVNVVVWDTLAPPATCQASVICHEGTKHMNLFLCNCNRWRNLSWF